MKPFRIILLLLSLLLLACVPTPETDVLQPMGAYEDLVQIELKADGQAVVQTPAAHLPRVEKDYVTEHGVHIVLNATVDAPDGQVYPVLRTRTCALAPERILSMLNALKQNGTLCEQPKADFSREQITDRIARIQDAIANSSGGTLEEQNRIRDLKEELAYYREAYETAPAESEINRDKPFNTAKITEKSAYTVVFRENGQTLGSVQVADDREEYAKYYFYYTGAGSGERKYTGGYPISRYIASELPFSESDAVQTAEAFLAGLGITEMRHVRTEMMVTFDPDAVERFGEPACYRLFFTRDVANRPLPQYFMTSWKMGFSEQDQKDYRPIWTPEYLDVCVDAEGVWTMRWQNPVEILETVNKSVPVISLDRALELFDRYMDLLRANGAYSGSRDEAIEITNIILGYQFLPVKDHLDEYYLTPCWVFLGTDSESRLLQADAAQLVLNAVDGTVL